MTGERFCYSVDGGETFEGDVEASVTTREEAVAECLFENDGQRPTHTARVERADAFLPRLAGGHAGWLLERVGQEAFELVGEVCDGWPNEGHPELPALDAAIRDVLVAWIQQHNPPKFWHAADVQTAPAGETPEKEKP